MKKGVKLLLLMFSICVFSLGGKMTAQAEEVVAPISAADLVTLVNQQGAQVDSLHGVLLESVRVTDPAGGQAVNMDMFMDMQCGAQVSHGALSLSMGIQGGGVDQTVSLATEVYLESSNGVMTTYMLNPYDNTWEKEQEAVESTGQNMAVSLSGIDYANALVTTDGQTYRITSTIDASGLPQVMEAVDEIGIFDAGQIGVYPVVIEIDAATLLPRSVAVAIPSLEVEGMQAYANVVCTYDGYNQYGNLAVPDAVKIAASLTE